MEPHDSYTRLLGLALRGGHLAVGSDAVASAVHAGNVRLLLLSADASPRTRRDAQEWARHGHCLSVVLPCDKAELGHALGRGTVAVAALTDTGLADALGKRLALLDPERYAEVAERLRRKVERAEERRAARARARPEKRNVRPRRPVRGRPPNRARPRPKKTDT
ncbi:MAG: ribosomal L7Ae/L30e/S12e/Gadd45 family protein [Oscillibacter sp.]|nr:ribosomal L7Ae/L30e/S12e/Gadd45 family protein [Oscillibacter sp.]